MKSNKFIRATMICTSLVGICSSMLKPMTVSAECVENNCVHGYHVYNDHYLKSANGSRKGTKCVWISSEFSTINAEMGLVTNGVLEWNNIPYITNYVKLQVTSTKSSAQIIIDKAELDAGTLGITYLIKDSSSEELYPLTYIPDYDFYRAYISLNETEMLNDRTWLNYVTTHEVGHALGLGHVDCAESIMFKYYNSDYYSKTITSTDMRNLRHIYC